MGKKKAQGKTFCHITGEKTVNVFLSEYESFIEKRTNNLLFIQGQKGYGKSAVCLSISATCKNPELRDFNTTSLRQSIKCIPIKLDTLHNSSEIGELAILAKRLHEEAGIQFTSFAVIDALDRKLTGRDSGTPLVDGMLSFSDNSAFFQIILPSIALLSSAAGLAEHIFSISKAIIEKATGMINAKNLEKHLLRITSPADLEQSAIECFITDIEEAGRKVVSPPVILIDGAHSFEKDLNSFSLLLTIAEKTEKYLFFIICGDNYRTLCRINPRLEKYRKTEILPLNDIEAYNLVQRTNPALSRLQIFNIIGKAAGIPQLLILLATGNEEAKENYIKDMLSPILQSLIAKEILHALCILKDCTKEEAYRTLDTLSLTSSKDILQRILEYPFIKDWGDSISVNTDIVSYMRKSYDKEFENNIAFIDSTRSSIFVENPYKSSFSCFTKAIKALREQNTLEFLDIYYSEIIPILNKAYDRMDTSYFLQPLKQLYITAQEQSSDQLLIYTLKSEKMRAEIIAPAQQAEGAGNSFYCDLQELFEELSIHGDSYNLVLDTRCRLNMAIVTLWAGALEFIVDTSNLQIVSEPYTELDRQAIHLLTEIQYMPIEKAESTLTSMPSQLRHKVIRYALLSYCQTNIDLPTKELQEFINKCDNSSAGQFFTLLGRLILEKSSFTSCYEDIHTIKEKLISYTNSLLSPYSAVTLHLRCLCIRCELSFTRYDMSKDIHALVTDYRTQFKTQYIPISGQIAILTTYLNGCIDSEVAMPYMDSFCESIKAQLEANIAILRKPTTETEADETLEIMEQNALSGISFLRNNTSFYLQKWADCYTELNDEEKKKLHYNKMEKLLTQASISTMILDLTIASTRKDYVAYSSMLSSPLIASANDTKEFLSTVNMSIKQLQGKLQSITNILENLGSLEFKNKPAELSIFSSFLEILDRKELENSSQLQNVCSEIIFKGLSDITVGNHITKGFLCVTCKIMLLTQDPYLMQRIKGKLFTTAVHIAEPSIITLTLLSDAKMFTENIDLLLNIFLNGSEWTSSREKYTLLFFTCSFNNEFSQMILEAARKAGNEEIILLATFFSSLDVADQNPNFFKDEILTILDNRNKMGLFRLYKLNRKENTQMNLAIAAKALNRLHEYKLVGEDEVLRYFSQSSYFGLEQQCIDYIESFISDFSKLQTHIMSSDIPDRITFKRTYDFYRAYAYYNAGEYIKAQDFIKSFILEASNNIFLQNEVLISFLFLLACGRNDIDFAFKFAKILQEENISNLECKGSYDGVAFVPMNFASSMLELTFPFFIENAKLVEVKSDICYLSTYLLLEALSHCNDEAKREEIEKAICEFIYSDSQLKETRFTMFRTAANAVGLDSLLKKMYMEKIKNSNDENELYQNITMAALHSAVIGDIDTVYFLYNKKTDEIKITTVRKKLSKIKLTVEDIASVAFEEVLHSRLLNFYIRRLYKKIFESYRFTISQDLRFFIAASSYWGDISYDLAEKFFTDYMEMSEKYNKNTLRLKYATAVLKEIQRQ